MASPLKFILALDAKMADMPRLEKTLVSIAKVLNRLDPGLKMTKAGLYGIGYAAGTAIKAVGGLMRALHGIGRAIDPLKDKGGLAGFIGGHVGGFLKDAASSFLGFASFEGLKSLAQGAINASMEMVKLASQAGETERILSMVAGPADAKRVQALADAFAKSSGIDSDAFNAMATGLLRAGLPLKKLENFFALASDITGLTQGLPDKAARTAKAMEVGSTLVNMQRKGGFDRKVLSDVGVSEDDFFKQIAKMKGIGLDEARARGKLGSSKGGFSSDVLFAAAERSLAGVRKGAPGSIGDTMGKSAGAQLDRVLGSKEDQFKALSGGEGITKMGDALARIADMLDPASATGQSITKGLDAMLSKMADVFKAIDVKTFSDTLVKLFTALPPLIMGTVKALELLATVVGKAFPGAASMTPQTGGDVAGIADWKKDNPVKQSISDFFRGIFGPSDEKLAQLYGSMIPEGFAQGIDAGSNKVIDSTFNMMDDVKRTATGPEGIDAHSPSRIFERYGRMTGEGFSRGISGSAGMMERATAAAIPAPSMDIRAPKGGGASGGGGGVTVTVPITINYTGAGGEEAAQQIAEAIKELLPGQLQNAFTRLALEAGTA